MLSLWQDPTGNLVRSFPTVRPPKLSCLFSQIFFVWQQPSRHVMMRFRLSRATHCHLVNGCCPSICHFLIAKSAVDFFNHFLCSDRDDCSRAEDCRGTIITEEGVILSWN